MHFFMNDYGELAHPSIFSEMERANMTPEEGYFGDSHSDKAREYIQRELGGQNAAAIEFAPGGTIANMIAISAFLRPHEGIIAPRSAHIHMHETGAIESIGHKILTVHSSNGKVTPEQIQDVMEEFSGEHMVVPKMVFITNATEIGTVYRKAELEALHECCVKNHLILYCDGARLGSALTSRYSDIKMKDLAKFTDAFYIGGTKNGALAGEAFVLMNPVLVDGFRYITKQKGGLMAKGKVVGIQFEKLFEEGLFYELATHENQMAEKIIEKLKAEKYEFLCEPESNQIFPILSEEKIAALQKEFYFNGRWEKIGKGRWAVRFVTSWGTPEESVNALINAL